MRLAHTAFGVLAALAWLLLPTTTQPAEQRSTDRPADTRHAGDTAPGAPQVVPAVGGELSGTPSGNGTAARGTATGPPAPAHGDEPTEAPPDAGRTAVGPAAERQSAPPHDDKPSPTQDTSTTPVDPTADRQPAPPHDNKPSGTQYAGTTTVGPIADRPPGTPDSDGSPGATDRTRSRPAHPVDPAASAIPVIDGWPLGQGAGVGPGDPAVAVPLAPPATGARPVAPGIGAAAPVGDEASGADLILPVAAAGAAVAVAAYSLVRRRRRAQLRTTPTGTYEPPTSPLSDLHLRAQRLLVETDDSVRTSAEELRFAAARPGHVAAEPPPDRPTDHDDTEPSAKTPAGPAEDAEPDPQPEAVPRPQPHGEGPAVSDSAPPEEQGPPDPTPPDPDAAPPTPHAAQPTGPTDADAGPPTVDSAEPRSEAAIPLDPAMPFAETPAGRDAVQPFVEALADARRELAGACRADLRLDEERGALPPDEERALLEEILTRCTTAQRRLDTATPAFDQLRALERDITPALECAETRFRELAGRTATAATTLTTLREDYTPAVSLPVAGHVEQAKDRLVFATTELNRARQAAYPGDLHTAAAHLRAAEGAIDQADLFVTGVERLAAELAHATVTAGQAGRSTGPYDDPFDVLRRQDRWFLPAHSAVATAADFVTTHRGAVGARARTRLWEAERHLTQAMPTDSAGQDENVETAADTRRAHALAQEARHLAEQDVRAYGNPYGGPVGDGLAGALLGGIVLGEPPGGDGRADLRGPACYGGTATRARRTAGGQF